jgi:xanthine dehydrogenase accessory factor
VQGNVKIEQIGLAELAGDTDFANVTFMSQFYRSLIPLLEAKEPFALALITGVKGSSPQKKGARAAFLADGRIVGTVGGGCLEAEIQDRARRALASGQPATFELVLDHDFGWDDGLICGGSVSGVILPRAAEAAGLWRALAEGKTSITWGIRKDFTLACTDNPGVDWLYCETIHPPCQLWIAGSGHIAQAVTPLAQSVDFEVTVFDDRPGLANASHFPPGTHFRVDFWEKLLADPLHDLPTFGVIVTRGHQHDALVLREWVHRPFAYLGMIGSRRKARLIFNQFVDEKIVSAEIMSRVCCPVGLEIHSQTPPEIAISIVAQLVQKRAELRGAESTDPQPS